MIRNANRNISVSKGHGYTVEKVKYAIDFINTSNRTKTLEDWVNAYNHIKGTNETAKGCQACKAAKFTAAVRNYAQYGYLTLINEGHKPEEFKDAVEEPVKEDSEATENGCETEKQSETVAEPSLQGNVEVSEDTVKEVVEETSPETCNDQEQVEEVAENQQQWEKLDESIIEQGVDAVIEKISETPIKKRTKKTKK